MKRYLVYTWLIFFLGAPTAGSFALSILYQYWYPQTKFYPVWLLEMYLFAWFPAVIIAASTAYWGKRHPKAYIALTIVLFMAVLTMGTWETRGSWGGISREEVVIKGIVGEQVLTSAGQYEILYAPVHEKNLMVAILNGQAVEVDVIAGTRKIVSFSNSTWLQYSSWERTVNVVIGVTATGTFAGFFFFVFSVWSERIERRPHRLHIYKWGRKQLVELEDIIELRWDENQNKMTIETNAVVFDFPYSSKMVSLLRKVAYDAGLSAMTKWRYVRWSQYKEVRIEETEFILQDEQAHRIPYIWVEELKWDGAIRVLTVDGEYLITDIRFTDEQWFDELANWMKRVWEKEGISYIKIVDREQETITYKTEWD
ncbi:hypothetical protein [Mechercharimyces sp. CAU 1602]|uniref:hypothetical protein n=1 Tax=Mechercharimyces sp. CAU 1602 TaxID=2973933 RepID=UPI0021631FDF|nr:hypothetical protein [Mechercharimyces sp. CAU 1602]MCS1352051.1 hypothetical protein [Mechercharimyces sp. CAU 1602]